MKFFLLCSLLISLLFFSCTTYSPYDRGSLSDAMDKSRDDHEGSRSVPNQREDNREEEWPDWDDEHNAPSEDQDFRDDFHYNTPNVELQGLRIITRGGLALMEGPHFQSNGDYSLLLGGGSERYEIYFVGGYTPIQAIPGSQVEGSIEPDAFILRCGGEIRVYLFKDWDYMSPYILGQMGGVLLSWTFKNPLDAQGVIISQDSVGGLSAALGAGVDIIRGDKVRLGVLFIPEIYLYSTETSQGFQNDVFYYHGSTRLAVELGIGLN